MEMLKDALCFELRNLYGVWTAANLNPAASKQHVERIRRKIHKTCDQLDAIEKVEAVVGA